MAQAGDKLWRELRNRRLDKMKFRRQVPIGRYVADFLCLKGKFIVEIDGSQHLESMRDHIGDAEWKARGLPVCGSGPVLRPGRACLFFLMY
jgi:very-short-patch-repair endonuclease